jgi:hypothetical protein
MEVKMDRSRASFLAFAQGIFYLATGIWPLVSAGTFQKVTGPKVDFWLVKTVGLLISVIGGVLAWAGLNRRVGAELAVLGAGSAACLAGVDLAYVAKRRISPVYLLDAAAEAGIVALWLAAGRPGRSARRASHG